MCLCDCGVEKAVTGASLHQGGSTSCGCYGIQNRKDSITTHGDTVGGLCAPEYGSWKSMVDRCANKNSRDFLRYGGRGIKVCERWLHSYENFLMDMWRKPSPKHSLDRIDVNGNYCPENCRWATPRQQANNKRNNRYLVFNDRRMTLTQWSEEVGLGKTTVKERLNRGWTIEQSLTIPVGESR